MVKFLIQSAGSMVVIGIEGNNKKEIESWFNSFYNHKATDGSLRWLTDELAYFWTRQDRLKRALYSQAANTIANEKGLYDLDEVILLFDNDIKAMATQRAAQFQESQILCGKKFCPVTYTTHLNYA